MQPDVSNSDYKTILKEELASRCRQNPRYSLRAFARDLKLSPTRLSEILSGKQGLSRPAAEKVAKALGYGATESIRFCDLVESVHARSRQGREEARVRLKQHTPPPAGYQLQLDAFKAIADWYHFGILEMTSLKEFKSDPKWIGKRLGISEFEVQLALDRLSRLGLIARKRDKIVVTHPEGDVFSEVPSESVRKFHEQIMEKAKEALFVKPVEELKFQSDILAIDKRRIAEAKQAINDFKHRFCKRMGESESKDGLYCLAVQFFELGDRG